jgi:hypothetical protein
MRRCSPSSLSEDCARYFNRLLGLGPLNVAAARSETGKIVALTRHTQVVSSIRSLPAASTPNDATHPWGRDGAASHEAPATGLPGAPSC